VHQYRCTGLIGWSRWLVLLVGLVGWSCWLVAALESNEWLLQGVGAFIQTALADLQGVPPRNRRAKHLLAMPHVSTGFGGQHHATGVVLEYLIPFLNQVAANHKVDIALCAWEDINFHASQVCYGLCVLVMPTCTLVACTERFESMWRIAVGHS
jgi:hypothetical protein